MEMINAPIHDDMTCQTCDGPLTSGPFGSRCARCVLSLVDQMENVEDSYVSELFPELRLEAQVAKGGFGAVYRAEHRRMRRTVALKFLDTLLARRPEAVALFEQEMISVGGLDHPGIVRAHDAGERDGHWYIIMELVEGMDCGSLVRKHGTLPVAESCEIIRQAAVALHHAHGKGLVHRDVKPGNLMVSRGKDQADPSDQPDRTDLVKVLDFGLAGLAVAPVFSQPVATVGSTLFLGTLEYISPEQIESPTTVDARADIYSLGATLWRLLTGKTPHGGASPEMSLFVQMKHITSEPVPSLATARPDLPKPLIHLCDAMLSLDREKRPASAAEVAHLLEPWCAGAELSRLFTGGRLEEKPFVFPKKNRRPLWIAAAAAAIIAVTATIFPTKKTAVPGPPPLEGSAVFSDAVARFHDIPPQNMPRLLSAEWEVESEHLSTSPFTKLVQARLRPDGRLMWIYTNDTFSIKPRAGEKWEEVNQVNGIAHLNVQPETGNIVWTPTTHPDDLVIHRILADGTKLAPIGPDFSKEAFAEGRAAMKAKRFAKGDKDGCASFRGMAFVTASNLPPGSGLSAGDVLYADEGHRDLTTVPNPLTLSRETSPGLWKFRFDSDAPAQRLGSLSPRWVKDQTNFPQDTTVSRHGVFLLNRNNTTISGQVIPSDFKARVFRWEPGGFHPCTTDQPILSPAGIAADPLSADLFVLDGGSIVQPGVVEQRILRLRPAGPDQYTVETFARKFRGFSFCGIQITPDGQRMVITDERLVAVVVLKRKD
jgi:serine/threonine protein kinase